MLDLLTGGGFNLAVIGGAILTGVAVLWRIMKAGRDAEKVKNLKRSNKQWVEADEIQGDVQSARRIARRDAAGDGLHDDDGFKRP